MSHTASKYLEFKKTNLRELTSDSLHRHVAIDKNNAIHSVILPCTHEGCYTTLAHTCLCVLPG